MEIDSLKYQQWFSLGRGIFYIINLIFFLDFKIISTMIILITFLLKYQRLFGKFYVDFMKMK